MDIEPLMRTPTNFLMNHSSMDHDEADIASGSGTIDWGVLIDYKDPYSHAHSNEGNKTVATTMKTDSHLESYLRSNGKSTMTLSPLPLQARTVETMNSTIHSRSTITTDQNETGCNSESFRDNDNDSVHSFDAIDLYEPDDWRTAFVNSHNISDNDESNSTLQLSVSSETSVAFRDAMENLSRSMARSNLTRNALAMQREMQFAKKNHSSCPNFDDACHSLHETNSCTQFYNSDEGQSSSSSICSIGTSKSSSSNRSFSRLNKNRVLDADISIRGNSSFNTYLQQNKSSRRTPSKANNKSKTRHRAFSGLISRRVNSKQNLLSTTQTTKRKKSSSESLSSMDRAPVGVRKSTSNSTWKKSTSIRSLIRQKQELLASPNTTATTVRRTTPVDGSNGGCQRLLSYYERANAIVAADAPIAVPCEEDLGEDKGVLQRQG